MVVLHTDIATRAPAPARAAPRVGTRGGSPAAARRERTAPRTVRAGGPAGIVLTAAPLLVARPALPEALRAAHCAVRAADTWRQLLEVVERSVADVVLVDLDGADRARHGHRFDMSGRRLVELLARSRALRPFGLVIQTALDFEEIEGLLRVGVHALVGPEMPDEDLGAHVRAVIARAPHTRRVRGEECGAEHHAPAPDCWAAEALSWPLSMSQAEGADPTEHSAW